MSVFPIPTNFTGLIEPRMMRANIFTANGVNIGNSGSITTYTPLAGSIGAGSILAGTYLVAPSGPNGISGAVTFTVSLGGTNPDLTGDVATFMGAQFMYAGQYYAGVVPQDSYVQISATASDTWSVATPSVLIQYLS